MGGSTTSTSRSPSPYRRRPSNGHPPRARADQQKVRSSPQKQAKGAASASLPTSGTARMQDRSPERSARLPASHAAEASRNKLHGSTAVPTVADVPVRALAAKDPAALPPPPVLNAPLQPQPSTSAAQDLPPMPVGNAATQPQPSRTGAQALPTPPAGGHGVSQPQTSSALTEQPEMRAARLFADQKDASQGYNPAHAAAASKAPVTQSNITGSAVPQQQRSAGHASSTSTSAAVRHSTPAGAQASAPSLIPLSVLDAAKRSTSTAQAEPQPADLSAVPAMAQADTPEHSFDGKQSFISLDVGDAPAGGAASVDQPSPASRKTKLIPPVPPHATAKAVSAQSPAASQAADKALPAEVTDAAQSSQQQKRQWEAAASAMNNAAATEADKRDIKPDLFTASRPSSAVSQGAGTLKFDADQKQLPAAKSKVATKGNIQIVLATKHKQVQMLFGLARIICSHCLPFARMTVVD